ncbi:MAG: sodium/solute symporter [Melioribacteraceae bacterium]|nr:sodium/solute symporter [Melioribacteraceae bacterium]
MIDNLTAQDNIFILAYFVIVLFIGIIASVGKDKTINDYFLAGKNMGWVIVGTSLFATNISSEHIIGLAGASSVHGLSVGYFEWIAVFILIMLGWLFAPIFIKSDAVTMPQFLGRKYGDKVRSYLTAVSLAAYFFTKIGVTIIAGGYLLSKILGLDLFTSAVFIVLLTGLYTVIGGLSSVMKTQLFQTVILLTGSILLAYFGLDKIGGVATLVNKLPESYFNVIKSTTDPDFPWTGILFGAPILGIWYWCTDQYIVQRILAAKGISDARKGTFLAAFLKLVPVSLLIIPGLVVAVEFPNIKGDDAITYLISGDLLPVGIKGIVIAGIFAAFMSSLSSAFNSSATLIAIDIFQPRKPHAAESQVVLVGRLATILIVILAILFIPLLKIINSQIYIYLQKLQAFISPPIASAFLFGIFWKKSSSKGLLWALVIGGVIGFIRIITSVINPTLIEDLYVINYFNTIHYLHFAVILFFISSAVLVAVSRYDNRMKKNLIFENENINNDQDDFETESLNQEKEKLEISEHK